MEGASISPGHANLLGNTLDSPDGWLRSGFRHRAGAGFEPRPPLRRATQLSYRPRGQTIQNSSFLIVIGVGDGQGAVVNQRLYSSLRTSSAWLGAIGLVDDVGDMAAFVDDEGDAVGHSEQTHRCCPSARCRPSLHSAADRAVGIGHQWETEVVFFGEALVGGDILGGNAENGGVLGLDFLVVITQRAGLLGAARSIVHRIKVQHQLSPK
jgi:hypothetical protein